MGEGRHQYARHYSGRYIIQDEKINGRAVYVQEQGSSAFLSYCAGNGINRWTISPIDNDEVPLDPCGKIVLVCLLCLVYTFDLLSRVISLLHFGSANDSNPTEQNLMMCQK